ncbi:MAG TPA: Smr/MutS family protein [Saprospiraceae bacterium]|nr:Smr/MutS family protein [Saprospiraceae bacterium]
MIDAKSLWIGEVLQFLSDGSIGTFEGTTPEGQLKIKINGSVRICSPSEVRIAPESEEVEFIWEDPEPIESVKKKKVLIKHRQEIDLHIDKLAPHLINGNKERILSFQLEKFREFMAHNLNLNSSNLLIIHGKGEGILREQIRFELKSISRVRFYFPVNKDGATEVWLD